LGNTCPSMRPHPVTGDWTAADLVEADRPTTQRTCPRWRRGRHLAKVAPVRRCRLILPITGAGVVVRRAGEGTGTTGWRSERDSRVPQRCRPGNRPNVTDAHPLKKTVEIAPGHRHPVMAPRHRSPSKPQRLSPPASSRPRPQRPYYATYSSHAVKVAVKWFSKDAVIARDEGPGGSL
jgi:hypothetical protein